MKKKNRKGYVIGMPNGSEIHCADLENAMSELKYRLSKLGRAEQLVLRYSQFSPQKIRTFAEYED